VRSINDSRRREHELAETEGTDYSDHFPTFTPLGMMASKLLSNGYIVTPPPLKSQGLHHHQGRLLPDGFGPCAAHVVGEPQQQLDRLLGAAQESVH
jgi:hypothetical protein